MDEEKPRFSLFPQPLTNRQRVLVIGILIMVVVNGVFLGIQWNIEYGKDQAFLNTLTHLSPASVDQITIDQIPTVDKTGFAEACSDLVTRTPDHSWGNPRYDVQIKLVSGVTYSIDLLPPLQKGGPARADFSSSDGFALTLQSKKLGVWVVNTAAN